MADPTLITTGIGARVVLPAAYETGRTNLALDLGTTTGWAIRGFDGLITSGTASFRPGRFDGGGMREPSPLRPLFAECLLDGERSAANRIQRHQSHFALGLKLQPAPDIGVGHRRQRMTLHAELVQEKVVDEQMTHKQPTPGRREGRADESHVSAEKVEQRFGDRSDIAFRRGIEGRAVLEDDLLAALGE